MASSHRLRNRKFLEKQDRRVRRQTTSRKEGSARSLHLQSQIRPNHRQSWQIQGSASCRRRPTSLRPLHSIDITTAFLYSSLDEEVYIFTPAGFPDNPESRRLSNYSEAYTVFASGSKKLDQAIMLHTNRVRTSIRYKRTMPLSTYTARRNHNQRDILCWL